MGQHDTSHVNQTKHRVTADAHNLCHASQSSNLKAIQEPDLSPAPDLDVKTHSLSPKPPVPKLFDVTHNTTQSHTMSNTCSLFKK